MKKFPLLKSNTLFASKEEEYGFIKKFHDALQKMIPLPYRVKLPDKPNINYI